MPEKSVQENDWYTPQPEADTVRGLIKCSAFIASSVDGFIARENHDVEWLSAYAPPGTEMGFKDFFESVDVIIMGRLTFEKCISFEECPYWSKKVVIITSGTEVNLQGKPLPEKCQIYSINPSSNKGNSQSKHSLVNLLKDLSSLGHKRAYIDGGLLISSFIAQRLLHDICITYVPVLVRSGISLFRKNKSLLVEDIALTLNSSVPYTSGYLQVHYDLLYGGKIQSSDVPCSL